MKEDASAPTTIPISSATSVVRSEAGGGKSRYKFWVLAAILLLAFWSMFTGSVTLKSSAIKFTRFSDDFDFPIHDDLDVLEVEEREKVVRHMWDVYTHSRSVRLPRFWLQAFEAAYEYLVSDVPGVRDAAVLEIAKMSMGSLNLHFPLDQSTTGTRNTRKSSKPAEESKEITTVQPSQ